MLFAALLFALQGVEFDHEDAHAEILDYRGRLEYCADYEPHIAPPDWRCGDLKADRGRLLAKFKGHSDLLKLLELESSKFDKAMIVTSQEWSQRLWAHHVEHIAVDGQNRKYRITADGTEEALQRLTVQLPGGEKEIVISLDEKIAYADLQTIRVWTHRDLTAIELNYGFERPWCFRSKLPDGKPILRIALRGASTLNVVATSYERCQLNNRKIPATLSPSRQ